MALEDTPFVSSSAEERTIWKEVKQQVLIAAPMLFVNLLQFLIQLTSLMLVGHLGKLSLSGASLATSTCMVTGFIIPMGLSAALETLCGQAYGAKQYTLMGIYLQRASVVLLLVSIPISVLWFNLDHALIAVGQDPTISAFAGTYARYLIPGLFAQSLFWPMVKFLQSQSIVLPMTVCCAVSLAVHVPLSWFLLYKLHIGGHGAAISVSVSYWIGAISMGAYIGFSCKETFRGFSMETFRDFSGFFKLAIPAAIMICVEAWTYELVTILAGLMPNPQVETASSASIMNTSVLFYMVPLSLSAAISTRTANELGAGNPSRAKVALGVTLSMALVDLLMVISVLLSFRKVIGLAFSNDVEVVEHIASLLKVVVFICSCDTIQGVLQGVCRGCGWQAIGAVINLFAFYVVGLPIAITLGFGYDLHAKGLWTGVAIGNVSQTVILCVMIYCLNWEDMAEKARYRILESATRLTGQEAIGLIQEAEKTDLC